MYNYDPAMTPVVTGMNRNYGSSAGGTRVYLTGERLAADDVSVELCGVTCALRVSEIGSYKGATHSHDSACSSSESSFQQIVDVRVSE